MNARTGGEIMASGSTNKSTGTASRTNTGSKAGSQTRRGTSSQTRRKKQSAANEQMFDDIITIVSAAVCIFLFLCNFRIIGSFGNAISDFMFGIFGLFAYVAPLFIGGSVIFYNIKRGDYVAIRKFWSIVSLCIVLMVIFELFSADYGETMKYNLKEIYGRCSEDRAGGGVFAGSIAYFLYKFLSLVGTILVLGVWMIISLILLTEGALIGNVKRTGKQVIQKSYEESDRWHERSERMREQKMKRRVENEERRSRMEEARKLEAEAKENDKILRMDRKVSGVMMDTSLKEAEPEPVPEKNIQISMPLVMDDMHEITLNAAIDEPVINKPLRHTETTVDEGMREVTMTKGTSVSHQELSSIPEPVMATKQPEYTRQPERIYEDEASARPKAVKPEPVTDAVKAQVEKEITQTSKPIAKTYKFPPIDLLHKSKRSGSGDSSTELKETALRLQQTLKNFGVNVTITDISQGPSVTRYELQPEQGVKVSKIVGLADDIKLNLAATDIRIEAPIPGKAAIGIEVPNKENMAVSLRDLLETNEFKEFGSKLAFAVGKDIGGKTVVTDIAKMPHMLIAGSTGSGKSVCINSIIMSILYKAKPEEVKLIMIDPKVVELSVYNGIPHLLIPVVTDPKKAAGALHWAVAEMSERYKKFADLNVRDLKGYNKAVEAAGGMIDGEPVSVMPQILIIVDELADLMMVAPGEVEESICRLAQLARAAGIHLIIATQRPSVDVITGLIKANMPSRIAFAVSSGVDSRTILDSNGAEKLLGKGDMLFAPQGYPKPARIQGAFVSDEEVSDVVDFLKNQCMGNGSLYDENIQNQIQNMGSQGTASDGAGADGGSDIDEYFVDAARFIIEKDKASIGMLQRAFRIGFNRAGRIMDQLYEAGVVGSDEGTKPRKVLMTEEQFEQYLEEINI